MVRLVIYIYIYMLQKVLPNLYFILLISDLHLVTALIPMNDGSKGTQTWRQR